MDTRDAISLIALAGAGVVAGLVLMVRGMTDYRASLRVAETSTSPIASLAAGEVRVSGTIEMAEATLTSPIEHLPCVYFRTTSDSGVDPLAPDPVGVERERSIGFLVRDATGTIRVFPRGARVDAPDRPTSTVASLGGDDPPPVRVRHEGAVTISEVGATMVGDTISTATPGTDDWYIAAAPSDAPPYHETRLELGDPVTVVGRALPFSDLPDPTSADAGSGSDPLLDDPEIAADMAAATAAGSLADDPAAAWGNAAIPGFGIGEPVRAPVIDPAAHPEPIADATQAAQVARRFEIAPETLVLAASDEVPLLIAYGSPGQVETRTRARFFVGLLGAVLAIVSAMVLALFVSGGVDV